jgi:ubiquitin-conjugating enzyme E2 O
VLTHSIGGLDDEMKYYYFTKGKLASVLDGANELVSASENAPSGSEGPAKAAADEEARWNQGDGVGKLSLGAILPLKKTIAGLEKLRAAVAAEASDPGAEQQP